MDKVTIISNRSNVGVIVEPLKFKRRWIAKGSKVVVDQDVFNELMYDYGFKYMIEQGILYVDDANAMQKAGLDEDEIREIQKVHPFTKEQWDRLFNLPNWRFKEEIKEMKKEQRLDVCDYMVKNNITDFEKCNIIKEFTERDIIKQIELKKSAQG